MVDHVFQPRSARLETMESIKKYPGVEHKVVTKGLKVFSSRLACDGTACTLITKGSCTWAGLNDEKWDRSRVDIRSRKGWSVRSGMFVGIFEFLFGNSAACDKQLDVSLLPM